MQRYDCFYIAIINFLDLTIDNINIINRAIEEIVRFLFPWFDQHTAFV